MESFLKYFVRLNQIQFLKKAQDAFFLHFEQQKPIVRVLRTGFAEKEQDLLFGLVFLINALTLAAAFLRQFQQQTP